MTIGSKLFSCFMILGILVLGVQARADDTAFNEGVVAYEGNDFAAARSKWEPLAEAGDSDAIYNIGVIETRGSLWPDEKSLPWYDKAVSKGNRVAQYTLGIRYLHGISVDKSPEKARELFEASAAQGFVLAKEKLDDFKVESKTADQIVQMYLVEEIAEKPNFAKGMSHYKGYSFAYALQEWLPLASAGNPDAQYGLGALYYNGLGMPKDKITGKMWFQKAADQGHVDAMNGLEQIRSIEAQGH